MSIQCRLDTNVFPTRLHPGSHTKGRENDFPSHGVMRLDPQHRCRSDNTAVNHIINRYSASSNNPGPNWTLTLVPNIWVAHLISNSHVPLASLPQANGGCFTSKIDLNSSKQTRVGSSMIRGEHLHKPGQEEARRSPADHGHGGQRGLEARL